MMNYTTLLNKDSMYNTPPCWCIYMTGLVMHYLENEIGGLENIDVYKRQNVTGAPSQASSSACMAGRSSVPSGVSAPMTKPSARCV